MKNSKLFYNILSLLVFLVALALWQLAATSARVHFFFGSPVSLGQQLVSNTLNGVLPHDMLITGFEALLGFMIGVTVGTLCGFILWYSPVIARIFKPYIVIAGAIPVFAFAPMIILWFGIDISMKIWMAAFSTFLISLTQAYAGAQNIDPEEFKLFKVLKASRFQTLQKVVFPSVLSWVFASMKLSIGIALLGAFIGEFISANEGVGYFMIHAGSLYDIPGVLAGAVYLILLSLIFNYAVFILEKNKMGIIKLFSVSRKLRASLKSLI